MTDVDDGGSPKHRRIQWVQRHLVNPPAALAVWTGLVPGYVLLETVGRRTGERRRTVVGMHVDGDVGWVVAEYGRHAGYVRNLEANPDVRVRRRGRWYDARARVVDDDDPDARLTSFGRRTHAFAVRRVGTDLLTVEVVFSPPAG